ncbi:nuclease-related domain-containing protein [Gracilibacillus dipsosauri]|uniref:nuclease-related domain-containing protein n=1 Tax=Gracilibacillus dipsosauri TaxID=178340 RepID=UPI002409D8B9
MIIKEREEPDELRIFSSLHRRRSLSEKEKKYFKSMQKGYTGEKHFDSLMKQLTCPHYLLNDLRFKHHNHFFQIDAILLLANEIYLFEIKNFEGEFYYDSEKLQMKKQIEVSDPLLQLQKSESLLRQLLQSHHYNIRIQGFVVFVHPEFTLYQAPLNKPIILPTQINQFIRQLNKMTSPLKRQSDNVAQFLKTMHIEKPPITNIPPYTFDQLHKGIPCINCHAFSLSVIGHHCICKNCGTKESIEKAVMRNVKEFKLLFPKEQVRTTMIQEWCDLIISKERIQRILGKNFHKESDKQWAYYK